MWREKCETQIARELDGEGIRRLKEPQKRE